MRFLRRLRFGLVKVGARLLFPVYKVRFLGKKQLKVNLCSGDQKIPGYLAVDIGLRADILVNLNVPKLPFSSNSIKTLACTSAINYFDSVTGRKIIEEVHRCLMPGGVCRFSTQDLDILCRRYLERDDSFFLQKSADGCDRFPGRTVADKFVNWFYGFESNGEPCRYVYSFESLAMIFTDLGFSHVVRKEYMESAIAEIQSIDNRSDQMFFLEATK